MNVRIASTRRRRLARRQCRDGRDWLARPSVLASAALALVMPHAALALPAGAQVAAGDVSVSTPSAGNMSMSQRSGRAIVNWQSFSIGAGEAVSISQPGTDSVLLNRVQGNNASTIAGRLSANGRVFLVNPAGVLFAPGSSVNVGSLVATTLDIRDADFIAGTYRFSGTSGASVRNAGTIKAAQGGTVALLGGQLANDGTISARLGTVALAAGRGVTLDFAGDGLTTVRIDEPASQALLNNTGLLAADGGQVILTARAANTLAETVLNQQGIVRARSVQVRNGRIVLDGGEAGVTMVGGTLDATGIDGLGGGRIDVTGNDVALAGGASVDVSGSAGGGTVRFGGGAGGQDASIRNANAVWIAPTAKVHANAVDQGNGGQVVIYGEKAARVFGTLTARGGARGGDGGLIETSGTYLDTGKAVIDASAPMGRGGTWLLDPDNILITASASGDTDIENNPDFTSNSGSAILRTSTLEAALNTNTAVSVTTGNHSSDNAGDITVDSPITVSNNAATTLTLKAYGGITLTENADIHSTTGKLNLVFLANAFGVGDASYRGILIGRADSGYGPTINTNGGDLTLAGGGGPDGTYANSSLANRAGVAIHGATIDTRVRQEPGAPGGSINMRGVATAGGSGVEVLGSQVTTGTGNIEMTGYGQSANGTRPNGVLLDTWDFTSPPSGIVLAALVVTPIEAGTQLQTTSGGIRIYGAGTNASNITAFPEPFHGGVRLAGESRITTESGPIDIRGRMEPVVSNGSSSAGVRSENVSITSRSGDISISGESSNGSPGIYLDLTDASVGGAEHTGNITLRALNDGSANSLQMTGSDAAIVSRGNLFVRPGGVDRDFRLTAANDVPINLVANGPGMTLTAAMLALFSPGFASWVFGSHAHTGRITVGASCLTLGGGAPCSSQQAFATNLTLANGGAGSAGIRLGTRLALPSKTLALYSAGPVSAPDSIQAGALLLAGPGSFTLTNAANHVGVFSAVDAGQVSYVDAGPLTIAGVSATSVDGAISQATTIGGSDTTVSGNLKVQVLDGGLTLGSANKQPAATGPSGSPDHSILAGGNIDLVMANGVFTNAGNGTLGAGGAWRVWARSWAGETRGNITPGNALPSIYGCTLAGGCGGNGAVPGSGNHFIYAQRPTLTITADGKVRFVGATNPELTYGTGGLVNGDTLADVLAGDLSTAATVNSPAGAYAIDGAFRSNAGYLIDYQPAALLVTEPPSAPAAAGLQPFFSSRGKTFIYETNLRQLDLCLAPPAPLAGSPPAAPPADVLAVEWRRVRLQPNLNNCIFINSQNQCGDF